MNYRIAEAIEQLIRYGGEPVDDGFYNLLEIIAALNDDMAHLRSIQIIEEQVEKAKTILDQIVENFNQQKNAP